MEVGPITLSITFHLEISVHVIIVGNKILKLQPYEFKSVESTHCIEGPAVRDSALPMIEALCPTARVRNDRSEHALRLHPTQSKIRRKVALE